MIDITSYVIDDINNFIDIDQYVSDDLKVFKQGEIFYVYMNEMQVLISYSVTQTTEFILKNFIEKDSYKNFKVDIELFNEHIATKNLKISNRVLYLEGYIKDSVIDSVISFIEIEKIITLNNEYHELRGVDIKIFNNNFYICLTVPFHVMNNEIEIYIEKNVINYVKSKIEIKNIREV